MCLGPSPVLLLLSTPEVFLYASLMGLPPFQCLSLSLPLRSRIPQGGLSEISSVCTIIGIGTPSRGLCLCIYSLNSEVFSIPFVVGGGGCSLAFRCHLWIVPHNSLVCPASSRSSILSPAVLTLQLLSSYKVSWNILDTIRMSCYSTGWLHNKALLWSEKRQVASEIHTVLAWTFHGEFLTSFRRSVKASSSSCIGPLIGATVVQWDLPLRYLSPHPLSSDRIIWWYLETLDSLVLML